MPLPTKKYSFPLDKTVDIPRRLSEYARGDKVLFVATTKASFITVGPIGADFIRLFEDGLSIRIALDILTRKHGADRQAELVRALADLLRQIETRGFYQHAEVKEDVIDSFTMLARLTNRCNLRCTHCLVSSSPELPTAKDLTTEVWCNILDEYALFIRESSFTRPRVTFTGGEAMSRLDVFELLSHSRSQGLSTELFTNGVMIVNPRIAARIAMTVDEVQVSLDGATSLVHDQIRGTGMFHKTLKGLHLLRDANAHFRLSIVVMPHNYDDLVDNLPTLIRELGNRFQVRLGLAVKEGRADSTMLFSSALDGEDKLKHLIRHLAQEGVRAERPLTPNRKSVSCGYARELTIDSDGLVYGCGPQMHPIGDVRLESFRAIANRTVGNSRSAEVDLVEGCRECDIRYVCGGICRLRNISRMGSAAISSCDRANKETNIMKLFGRSSTIVPLAMLLDSKKGGHE